MTNSELLDLVRESPTEGHRAIIKEYSRYVYSIIYNKLRSCGTNEDIEECMSDVFADIFLTLDRYDQSNIKSLAGTIAKRTAIDRFRTLTARNNKTVYIDEDNMQELASGFNVENISDTNELRRIILDKIDELGEPDSTILIQKFYYNKTLADIADSLSMKATSVRSRCSRALERLKNLLAASGITQ